MLDKKLLSLVTARYLLHLFTASAQYRTAHSIELTKCDEDIFVEFENNFVVVSLHSSHCRLELLQKMFLHPNDDECVIILA